MSLDPRLAVRWLVLVAFLARVAFAMVYGLDAPALKWGDDHEYHAIAVGLAFDGRYENLWFPPGYPLFLAAIYKVFGANLVVVRLIQALLGALTCLLTFHLGRRLFSAEVGLVAAALLAIYPGHLYMSWRLMAETLYILLIALGAWLAIRFLDQPTVKDATLLALTLGMANAVKSNLFILPPLLIATAAWVLLRRRPRPWKPLAALAVVFAAATSLTPLANLVASKGSVAFLTGNAGHTLWWSNNPEADGYFVSPRDSPEAQAFITRQGMSEALEKADRLEKDRLFRRLAVRWVSEHPGAFLRLCLAKLANAYGPLPRAVVFEGNAKARWAHVLSFGLIFPLAIVGLGLSWRRWRQLLVPYLILACHLVMVLIFYGTPRFTIIIVPYLLIFASLTLVTALRRWTGPGPVQRLLAPSSGGAAR